MPNSASLPLGFMEVPLDFSLEKKEREREIAMAKFVELVYWIYRGLVSSEMAEKWDSYITDWFEACIVMLLHLRRHIFYSSAHSVATKQLAATKTHVNPDHILQLNVEYKKPKTICE